MFEWIWQWLPDKCEVPDCCRKGIRGNENRIDGRIVCDYCHANMIEKHAETKSS
jgi:hypothetical protein